MAGAIQPREPRRIVGSGVEIVLPDGRIVMIGERREQPFRTVETRMHLDGLIRRDVQ